MIKGHKLLGVRMLNPNLQVKVVFIEKLTLCTDWSEEE